MFTLGVWGSGASVFLSLAAAESVLERSWSLRFKGSGPTAAQILSRARLDL